MREKKRIIKFRNRDRQLSRYSFCCGYIQTVTHGSKEVSLHWENPTFHVRGYDFIGHTRLCWHVFESNDLTSARKAFFEECRKIGLNRNQGLALL